MMQGASKARGVAAIALLVALAVAGCIGSDPSERPPEAGPVALTTGPNTSGNGSAVPADAPSTSAEHFTVYFNATPEGNWVAWNWTLTQAIQAKRDDYGHLAVEILPLLNDPDDLSQLVFYSFHLRGEDIHPNGAYLRGAESSTFPPNSPPEEGGEAYHRPMGNGHGFTLLGAIDEEPQVGDRYLLVVGAVADEAQETAIHFRVLDPGQRVLGPTDDETRAARDDVFTNVLPTETPNEPAAQGDGVYYATYVESWRDVDGAKELSRHWSETVEPTWTVGDLDTPFTLDRSTQFTLSHDKGGFALMAFRLLGEPARATDLHFHGELQGMPVDLETRNPANGACTTDCVPPDALLLAEMAGFGPDGIHLEFDAMTRGVFMDEHYVHIEVASLGVDPGAISGLPVSTYQVTRNDPITDT